MCKASEPIIKTIEDLSLNAWPSHQIQIYDGWLLRFSYFYTHRTNCVEQIGASGIPLDEKVAYCEEEYRKWGTPCIFKISPLLDPSFDDFLQKKGYVIQHTVYNMILSQLSSLSPELPSVKVSASNYIPDEWIKGLFMLKGTTNIMHRTVVPSMYRAIPKPTICVSVRDSEHHIIGTGLGILDRKYVGVYAIHVHPAFRHRGYAKSIVNRILQEGKKQGAESAYLQVVADNIPALALYRSIGFETAYSCWFRVKYTV